MARDVKGDPAREAVIEPLRRLVLRLRARSALEATARGLAAWLLLAASVRLALRLALIASGGPALAAGATLVVAWIAWSALRPVPAARAAALADRHAGLDDALTTACWFLEGERRSPWVEEQRRRAAEQARALDASGIVPLRVPTRTLAAAAVSALLAASVGLLPVASSPRARVAAGTTPPGTPPDGRAEAAEAQPLPLDAREEALARLAAQLEEAQATPRETEGLRAEELAALAARLRELASALSGAPGDGGDASLRQALEALADDGSAPAVLEGHLSAALEALDRGEVDLAGGAVAEAAESLEALDRRIESDPRSARLSGGEGTRQQDAARVALADADPRWSLDELDPKRFGESSGAGMRGDAAAPGQRGDPAPGEATRLAVQLEVERLSAEGAQPARARDVREEASRSQGSRLGYTGRAEAAGYRAGAPLDAAPLAGPDRELVRRYFLALNPEADEP